MANGNDIFNRNVSNMGGVFTADRAKLTLQAGLGTLVQRLSMSYSQSITRLYEVGGSNIYYVGGRTAGQMTLDRVIGPSGTIAAFYKTYGDVCNVKSNGPITFQLTETDCTTSSAGTPATYQMANCVITQVTVGVESQTMIISENTTMMFSSLQVSNS